MKLEQECIINMAPSGNKKITLESTSCVAYLVLCSTLKQGRLKQSMLGSPGEVW